MRRQWGAISPYSTIAVGFDHQINIKGNNFSGGIFLLNDRSNYSSFHVNEIYLSGAYHKIIKNNHFHVGLQAGYVNKHYPKEKISLPDQFDNTTGYFNPNSGTNEPIFREQLSYMDINFGIGWNRRIRFIEPFAGIAFFHVNQPQGSFINGSYKLPLRLLYQGGAHVHMHEKFYASPFGIYMSHAKASELLFGSNFTYVINDVFMEKSVFIGLYLRDGLSNFDAMIFTAGLNYGHWSGGISYDLNMSELSNSAKNPAGIEISIIYKAISKKINKLTIPCERY
jgi:type IX secretion system PorP/SprF family membrane protein